MKNKTWRCNFNKMANGTRNMLLTILGAVLLIDLFTGSIGLLSAVGVGTFSAADTGGEVQTQSGIPDAILGEDADVDTRAKDVEDASSVTRAVPVDIYSVNDAGDETFENSGVTNGDGSRASVSGVQVGESYSAYYGVGNSSVYADRDPSSGERLMNQKSQNSDGQVYEIVTGGNLGLSLFDEDDNSLSSGVSVGSGETYRFEKMRVSVNTEGAAHNLEYVYINDTHLSGVDEFRIDDGEEIAEPDKLASEFSTAFKLNEGGDLLQGEAPSIRSNEDVEFGQIELDMESGNDPSGKIEICVDDHATFKNDDDMPQNGAEDQDSNDVGLSKQCFTQTIN